MPQFYAYVHFRPDMTPFYVGKGTKYRASNFTRRNSHHKRVVAKHGRENIVIEIMPCKSEAEAFLREILSIRALRLSGVELTNKTDGGEGVSGFKWSKPSPKRGVPLSAELRAQMSARAKGRIVTTDARGKISKAMKGRVMSAHTKLKMSAAATQLWATQEVREKRIVARKNRPPFTPESRIKMSASQTRRWAKFRKEQNP